MQKAMNITEAIKAANGAKGRGACVVRVKRDSEWNEIQIRLMDGATERASTFVDIGHTKETKAEAVIELQGTVKRFQEF